ncbi:MAG: hypothetical protein ACK5SQ_03390 [Chitinophagales bacterium]
MLDRWTFITTTLAQREIPFSLARFRQQTVPAGVDQIDIPAYNEILFLLNAEKMPLGTRFVSDTNMFDVEHATSTDSMEEFGGLLKVYFPATTTKTFSIEFLQIIR